MKRLIVIMLFAICGFAAIAQNSNSSNDYLIKEDALLDTGGRLIAGSSTKLYGYELRPLVIITPDGFPLYALTVTRTDKIIAKNVPAVLVFDKNDWVELEQLDSYSIREVKTYNGVGLGFIFGGNFTSYLYGTTRVSEHENWHATYLVPNDVFEKLTTASNATIRIANMSGYDSIQWYKTTSKWLANNKAAINARKGMSQNRILEGLVMPLVEASDSL